MTFRRRGGAGSRAAVHCGAALVGLLMAAAARADGDEPQPGATGEGSADASPVIVAQTADGAPAAVELPAIDVEAQGPIETATGPVQGFVARRSGSGSKTDTPLLETPQSISVITRDQMDQQDIQTVAGALRYTAGVQTGNFGFDPRFDQFAIRGFENERYVDFRDGMRQPASAWLAYWRTEPYGLERIDVIKGPASVLYGQAMPGGIVNKITKRPLPFTFGEAEVQYGNNDRYQGQFDLGGSIANDARYQARLTGLWRDSGTEINEIDDDRRFIAPAFTWQPNEKTTLTLLANYQHDRTAGSATLFTYPDGEVSDIWDGDEKFDKLDQDQVQAGYLFEHKFTDRWIARQNLRYGYIDLDYQYLQSDSLQDDGVTVDRSAYRLDENLNAINIDNQLQGGFDTGPVQHTPLVGVDYIWVDSTVKYLYGPAPSLNLDDPDYHQEVPQPRDVLAHTKDRVNQIGIYGQNQMAYENWRLVFGLRHDWASDQSDDRTTDTTNQQDDDKTTGRVGLLYLFDMGLAPYASYSTSFLPQPGTDANGDPFKPTEAKQYEVGVKYQPPGINASVTLAAFNITQKNSLSTDPNNEIYQVAVGEIRSRGLELEAVASVLDGLDIVGSLTYQDVEITQSNDGDQGNRPSGTPKYLAALWADYTQPTGPLQGLGAGAGVRYVGSSYGDNAHEARENDAYALVDAALHYEWNSLRLGINATNLFDKDYIITQDGYTYRGEGRTVMASLRYRW